jgi:hypothetical protein
MRKRIKKNIKTGERKTRNAKIKRKAGKAAGAKEGGDKKTVVKEYKKAENARM